MSYEENKYCVKVERVPIKWRDSSLSFTRELTKPLCANSNITFKD